MAVLSRSLDPGLEAEPTAQSGRVIMEPGRPSGTDVGGGGDKRTEEPSVTSSLEHLVASSQGIISKRIDLALLEGREMLSRSLQGAALVGFGAVLAAAAWLSVAGSVVLWVLPDASWIVRLAAFALLNGGGAVALVALAVRRVRREPPVPNLDESRANSTA